MNIDPEPEEYSLVDLVKDEWGEENVVVKDEGAE